MFTTGQSGVAVDAIGAALSFMCSNCSAAAKARSQCASFKIPEAGACYTGLAGVLSLAAAVGLHSPELERHVSDAELCGAAGDLKDAALEKWAADLDERLAAVVYVIDNKLSAVDIALAVQIKLRLFSTGACDKSITRLISPSHVRFFNNIQAVVGQASGSTVFASELKHPGGVKVTPPSWPDLASHTTVTAQAERASHASASPAAASAVSTADTRGKPVAKTASAVPVASSSEKKEKAEKVEKPKEPEPSKSKGNDASALDIRVGVVRACANHPEADKLYVFF